MPKFDVTYEIIERRRKTIRVEAKDQAAASSHPKVNKKLADLKDYGYEIAGSLMIVLVKEARTDGQ